MHTPSARECILERLRESPTMLYACAKCGVGRATAYRWMEEDRGFAAEVRRAQTVGRGLFCDVSEMTLFRAAKDGDQAAAKFILARLHPDYRRREPQTVEEKERGLAELLRDALSDGSPAPPSDSPQP